MRKTLTNEATQDSITVTKILDGNKNTVLVVSGSIKSEEDSTFDLIEEGQLLGNPKSLRLDSAAFLIEAGLKFIITYKNEPYFLPFEGKGKLELDSFGGLQGHELLGTLVGTGRFFIVLDISKIGV